MSYLQPVSKLLIKPKRILTSQATKQNAPDLKIQIPYTTNAALYKLTVIPNAQAQTDANLEIYIAGELFFICDAGDLTDVTTLDLPIPIQGYKLDQLSKQIEIFLWGKGQPIAITIISSMGVQ